MSLFNSSGSIAPSSDPREIPEHPELLRSNRELAEKIAELYNVEESERAEMVGVIETEIKGMDPEEGRSLLRWVYGIEYHEEFLKPGRVMTRPDAKILELHMRERFKVANRIYECILGHTKQRIAKMKEVRSEGKEVNDDAFRTLEEADMPDRLRIREKVEAIEARLSNDDGKIPTWSEISEWRTFLQDVLARNGIKRDDDKDGATRRRVQYLLTSVESLKNLNSLAINRQRLLDSEGGRLLIANGYLNPDGSFPPVTEERMKNAIRDPVGLGIRAVALVASTIYTVLAGTAFLQKKERGPLDALWVVIPGFIAAKMAGLVRKPTDELTVIRAAEQKTEELDRPPKLRHDILEPASMATLVMGEKSRNIYENMGGRGVAADCVNTLAGILMDGEKRDALSRAMRNGITDKFLDEFAGEDTPFSQSLKKLTMEDRLRFFNAMKNPLSSSQRLAWFAAVESVLRT